MAKTTYIYKPTMFELATRSVSIPRGLPVQLSKPPTGGRGLPRRFAWVQTLDGKFLGMVLRECLVRETSGFDGCGTPDQTGI